MENQRACFQAGRTLPAAARIDALKRLRAAILARQDCIHEALRADLGKSPAESYMCETGLALSELSWMISHTARLSRERRVPTPLAQYVSRSFVKPSPYGTVLIMSPWNYPFLLTIGPLCDALAAGNTAVVKPSAYSPATSQVLAELLGGCFPPELVRVVSGGRQENSSLLSQKFDMIFFTGSQSVGKEVLRRAAEHLTPAVLELGGKSPCIIEASAQLPLAARRIVFGKFLNCGQTCIAPDYILCQESVKEEFLSHLRREITRQFGAQPLENPNYGHIINEKHYQRLRRLLMPEKVFCGGDCHPEALQIAPTVMDGVCWDDAVMQEEIFGPILPVLTYRNIEEIPTLLANRPKPLALYLFSENRPVIRDLLDRCSFGGGCVNDVVIHLATSSMGFGGVGESGMGAYHGRAGFEAFSHRKSIVDKKTWLDLPMRYQPYTSLHDKLIHFFLK